MTNVEYATLEKDDLITCTESFVIKNDNISYTIRKNKSYKVKSIVSYGLIIYYEDSDVFIRQGNIIDKFSVCNDINSDVNKINHPSHYTWLKDKCGIEVIDIVRHLDFDTGNAIKYLLRAGHKSEEGYTDKAKTIEDLNKAIWYIKDKIQQLNKQ